MGFLVLYGSLFVLVRDASRELVHRNDENKLQYERQQTRRAELAALYDLSRALADARDFDTTLAIVIRHAIETVHVMFSQFVILQRDEFVIRAANPFRMLDGSLKMGERVTLGSNQVYKRVWEQNVPVVISADNPDLSQAERETLSLGVAETVCLMPLRPASAPLAY